MWCLDACLAPLPHTLCLGPTLYNQSLGITTQTSLAASTSASSASRQIKPRRWRRKSWIFTRTISMWLLKPQTSVNVFFRATECGNQTLHVCFPEELIKEVITSNLIVCSHFVLLLTNVNSTKTKLNQL